MGEPGPGGADDASPTERPWLLLPKGFSSCFPSLWMWLWVCRVPARRIGRFCGVRVAPVRWGLSIRSPSAPPRPSSYKTGPQDRILGQGLEAEALSCYQTAKEDGWTRSLLISFVCVHLGKSFLYFGEKGYFSQFFFFLWDVFLFGHEPVSEESRAGGEIFMERALRLVLSTLLAFN